MTLLSFVETLGAPSEISVSDDQCCRSGELAFYRCFSPRSVPLSELVRVDPDALVGWGSSRTLIHDPGMEN
ncbi:hypothetical protein SNL152K_9468 [Streptomyces sp. NL15-2K]|nr:hypothetical protein SNL152K_9468 [Streptomyces sp. NL15-2K]